MPGRDTLTISLPPSLRSWIEAVVNDDGYGNTSEYLRELIRSDKERRERERLERRLLEAIESGPPESITSEHWTAFHQALSRREGRPPT